jgi:hypothetical protein
MADGRRDPASRWTVAPDKEEEEEEVRKPSCRPQKHIM